eukprot:m.82319 g.82319  ORF g.82319 m.82319 type:complete len:343 (-) comp25508_c0_seq2:235-1263(-)
MAAHDSLAEVTADGAYTRKESVFRNVVSFDNPDFQPEKNRYHLYISNACPWANRCNAVRVFKRLDTIIGLSVVHPTWLKTKPDDKDDTHFGWGFTEATGSVTPPSGHGSIPNDGAIPDTVNGFKYVRDLYEASNDTLAKFTVPVLWDTKKNVIVNNESSEIIRMFNGDFAKLVGSDKDTVDLYPESLSSAIDDVNSWIYPQINNGVYRCGFAKQQQAYDTAVTELFDALEKVEAILSKQRYIASSEQITEADIRLFMTLVRFDEVYIVYFKCNVRSISSYPNMLNYMRELYQMPFLTATINMDHIKRHYFCSHPTLNTYSIIPKGPGAIEDFKKPHNREQKA